MANLTTVIQCCPGSSSQGNHTREEIKVIQITKEEVKLPPVREDTILHTDDLKENHQEMIRTNK